MANNEPRGSDTANDAVFAMDPEPTLRELVRYLVARQQQMADLSRAMNRGVHDRDVPARPFEHADPSRRRRRPPHGRAIEGPVEDPEEAGVTR